MGNIIAPPSASRDVVLANLGEGVNARFDLMARVVWVTALDYGIDPVGMIAQMGKETGWGHFPGQVLPNFFNTCGLKISPAQQEMFPGITDDDRPLAHDLSGSWEEGACKHAEHLWAWCGRMPEGLILDKRFAAVRSLLPTKGTATTWEDLGGRWAPSPTYGIEIEEIRMRLTGG